LLQQFLLKFQELFLDQDKDNQLIILHPKHILLISIKNILKFLNFLTNAAIKNNLSGIVATLNKTMPNATPGKI
jgi:hypothetical protein